MIKKLLILNGSHSEIPIIKSAKDLNFKVYTIGNDPCGLGHKFSDVYKNIDYRDKYKVLKFCVEEGIYNVLPAANDLTMYTFAFLKKELGLSYFDSVENINVLHNKTLFKSLCHRLSIKVPRSFNGNDMLFPAVVKPVDSCGGRGISIVRNCNEIENASVIARNESPTDNAIYEEFIEGTLHSFSTFLKNQKVLYFYCDREFNDINFFSVNSSFYPAGLDEAVVSDLVSSVEKIADDLNLEDGVFHLQFVLSLGVPYVLEATRRMSGDLYAEPLKLALGLDWSKLYLKSILGLSYEIVPVKRKKNFGRICIMSPKNGVISKIEIDKKLEKIIVESYYILNEGDEDLAFKTQRVAVLILDFNKGKIKPEEVSQFYRVFVL